MPAVDVEGRTLHLSNLDKVLYPAAGFTKGQVIDYYARVAPVLAEHLRGRPVTLKRYPDGVEGGHFFEKNCPSHAPDWVRRESVRYKAKSEDIRFCLLEDRPSLVWSANLAALELHPSLATWDRPQEPTMIAFDLDPGPPAGMADCLEVAFMLRGVLEKLGLQSFVKTSGGKGLHLYVPLNRPGITYEQTTPLAQALAALLAKQHPDRVVFNMRKDLRVGKVLVDWSQNSPHKTTVGAYSLRAREQPTVSAPVTWDEVEDALSDPSSLVFEAPEVLRRVEERGDLFAGVLSLEQELPKMKTA